MLELKRSAVPRAHVAIVPAAELAALGGPFAAGSYDLGLDREYWAIRNAAALIDISPLIKYGFQGKRCRAPAASRHPARYPQDAGRTGLLHRLVRRTTASCIDDGTVTRLGEQTLPADGR